MNFFAAAVEKIERDRWFSTQASINQTIEPLRGRQQMCYCATAKKKKRARPVRLVSAGSIPHKDFPLDAKKTQQDIC